MIFERNSCSMCILISVIRDLFLKDLRKGGLEDIPTEKGTRLGVSVVLE